MIKLFDNPPDFETLYWYKAKVLRWVDGDTVDVDFDLGRNVVLTGDRLRLFGINTPERGQPNFHEATALAEYIAPVGSEVLVQTIKDKAGKYGRYLAVVWGTTSGKCVNQELLDDSLAVEYKP